MEPYRSFPAAAAGAVVFLSFLAPQAAWAAVEAPWNLPALSAKPEDILHAAAASPAPKDGDIEMLFEEHVYTLDEQGRQHRTSRRVYRYLTDKGVDDWSCTEADWSPWCEEKPVFRVRVITPDGQAHALDQEAIGEAPAEQDSPNMFSDDKLLRGPLPAIGVGAVVEEEIETREIRSLFDHGIVERFLLSQQYPVRKLRLAIDAPASLPLKYQVISSDAAPVRVENKGRVSLVFELGPTPATEAPEEYLPAEEAKTPQVVFSTGKSWNDVAAAYAELVESHLDLEAVRPWVQKVIAEQPDRQKLIERLLTLLRSQIRYTGVEFGKGAIVPRSSRETLARRYGDCKDQATLLVAMLRLAGIRAEVALLRTGRYGDVAPGLPGLGDFDHAIVYVPGEQPLWIDPSARCAPAGCLPIMDQDRLAMLANPETQELIHTGRMDYRTNTSQQVLDLYPAEYGKGRLQISVTCGGSSEEDMREDYASLGIKTLRKRWKDYLKEQFHVQTSPRLEYSPPLDLAKPFHVTAEVADARIGQFDDTTAAVTLQPDSLFQRLPDLLRGVEPEEDDHSSGHAGAASDGRKGSLLLPEPHIRQVQYRIHLPAGYRPKALPQSSRKQYGPASISQKYEITDDDVIVATFRLDTGPGRFKAEEVDDLRQAIAELAKDESTPWEVSIRLENSAERAMAAGHAAEALEEARRELARHAERAVRHAQATPPDALPGRRAADNADLADQHEHYSRLLMKAGLGEAAREEARQAIELAPRSAAAHGNLARTLTYDLLGRHFRPGMDWAAAAAAYSKALELDPSDVMARMDYGILLEHDEDGVRYAPGTRLDEAIDEYRKAQRQLGPRNRLDQLEVNLALALLFSEKFADLEKLASRADKSAAWRGFLVAAVAARQGVLEADHKASEIAADADARREIVLNAAEYLQQARLYAQAGALYEAAAQGSPKADELKAKAKAIAALRRMGDAELSQDPARRVVQQLFAAALSGSKAREKIPALFVSTASPAEVAAELPAICRAVGPALDLARENQVPPLRLVDGVLQAEIKVEGDAPKGFEVHAAGEQLNDSVWHVVMEQGQARLVAAGLRADKLPAAVEQAIAAVAAGSVSQQLLDDALAAVKQGNKEDAACLRALATVYAELGKTSDALESLRRAVAARGERTEGADWYILGRIAEQYGLDDIAAALYRKVAAREGVSAADIYTLAQRRLKKVGR